MSALPRLALVAMAVGLWLPAGPGLATELALPPGFTSQVYVTGHGFDRGGEGSGTGVPVMLTLGMDGAGAEALHHCVVAAAGVEHAQLQPLARQGQQGFAPGPRDGMLVQAARYQAYAPARAPYRRPLVALDLDQAARHVLALVLRVVLDRALPTIELLFTPADLLVAALVFAAAGVLGTLVPVWRLRRIDPLEAFGS